MRATHQVVRLEGEYWTIVFDGRTCRLRDTNGVRYLAYLLERPHEEVSALEIRQAIAPRRDRGSELREQERARVNVSRSVSAVLRRLANHHPVLADHLRETIHTGGYCSYRPDPRLAITWNAV